MVIQRVPNLVSIVIGCYNSEKYIEEALDSLAAQTYRPIEIIVVNDGSTDGTDEVIKRWQMKEKNQDFVRNHHFIYHRLPYNLGFAASYTTGLFLARGEFIAIQDADDLSHPHRIETQVDFMRKNPNIGMVGTSLESFEDGNFNQRTVLKIVKFGLANIAKIYANGGHCVSFGTILFRGGIFDQLGGLERYPWGNETIAEDYFFIKRYFSNGVRLANIPEVLYYYRKHAEQRTKQAAEQKQIAQNGIRPVRINQNPLLRGKKENPGKRRQFAPPKSRLSIPPRKIPIPNQTLQTKSNLPASIITKQKQLTLLNQKQKWRRQSYLPNQVVDGQHQNTKKRDPLFQSDSYQNLQENQITLIKTFDNGEHFLRLINTLIGKD